MAIDSPSHTCIICRLPRAQLAGSVRPDDDPSAQSLPLPDGSPAPTFAADPGIVLFAALCESLETLKVEL